MYNFIFLKYGLFNHFHQMRFFFFFKLGIIYDLGTNISIKNAKRFETYTPKCMKSGAVVLVYTRKYLRIFNQF